MSYCGVHEEKNNSPPKEMVYIMYSSVFLLSLSFANAHGGSNSHSGEQDLGFRPFSPKSFWSDELEISSQQSVSTTIFNGIVRKQASHGEELDSSYESDIESASNSPDIESASNSPDTTTIPTTGAGEISFLSPWKILDDLEHRDPMSCQHEQEMHWFGCDYVTCEDTQEYGLLNICPAGMHADCIYDCSEIECVPGDCTAYTIKSPPRNATWEIGAPHSVQWELLTHSNEVGKIPKGIPLLIYIDKDGSAESFELLANDTFSEGTWEWTPSQELVPGTYRLSIQGAKDQDVYAFVYPVEIAPPIEEPLIDPSASILMVAGISAGGLALILAVAVPIYCRSNKMNKAQRIKNSRMSVSERPSERPVHTPPSPKVIITIDDGGNDFEKNNDGVQHENYYYQCDVCDIQFTSQGGLLDHKTTHEDGGGFICPKCNKTFSKKQNLANHFITHTDLRPWNCEICPKRFNRKGNLTRHMRTHMGVKPYPCPYCWRRFADPSNFKKHLTKLHPAKPAVRPIENLPAVVLDPDTHPSKQEFPQTMPQPQPHTTTNVIISPAKKEVLETKETPEQNQSQPSQQQIVVSVPSGPISGATTITTPTSSTTTSNAPIVSITIINRPQYSKEPRTTKPPKKYFECDICHKSLATRGNLKIHMNAHAGVRPFVCTVCDMRFLKKQNLENHQITHTGNKPFQCEVCDRRFNRKGNLDRHKKIHLGFKPFPCPYCWKRFADPSNFKKHLANSHPDNPPVKPVEIPPENVSQTVEVKPSTTAIVVQPVTQTAIITDYSLSTIAAANTAESITPHRSAPIPIPKPKDPNTAHHKSSAHKYQASPPLPISPQLQSPPLLTSHISTTTPLSTTPLSTPPLPTRQQPSTQLRVPHATSPPLSTPPMPSNMPSQSPDVKVLESPTDMYVSEIQKVPHTYMHLPATDMDIESFPGEAGEAHGLTASDSTAWRPTASEPTASRSTSSGSTSSGSTASGPRASVARKRRTDDLGIGQQDQSRSRKEKRGRRRRNSTGSTSSNETRFPKKRKKRSKSEKSEHSRRSGVLGRMFSRRRANKAAEQLYSMSQYDTLSSGSSGTSKGGQSRENSRENSGEDSREDSRGSSREGFRPWRHSPSMTSNSSSGSFKLSPLIDEPIFNVKDVKFNLADSNSQKVSPSNNGSDISMSTTFNNESPSMTSHIKLATPSSGSNISNIQFIESPTSDPVIVFDFFQADEPFTYPSIPLINPYGNIHGSFSSSPHSLDSLGVAAYLSNFNDGFSRRSSGSSAKSLEKPFFLLPS